MFLGSINSELRSILAEMAPKWKGLPVYVGCSGNFTVERILALAGVKEIHGNDVSLYSCMLGRYLAGEPTPVRLKVADMEWVEPFLDAPVNAIAAVMLLQRMMEFYGRNTPYHHRMMRVYTVRFPDLHRETVDRVKKALEGVKLQSFCAGDVAEWMEGVPNDAVAVSFPPTYRQGYERLYAKLMEVLDWDAPSYTIFDEARLTTLLESMTTKAHWVIARDMVIPSLAPFCRGLVQTGMRSKPVYVYSDHGSSRRTGPEQKVELLDCDRLGVDEEIPKDAKPSVSPITQGQMNMLRSEYLSPSIAPAPAWLNLAVAANGKLAGALAFAPEKYGGADSCYMMTDFPVISRRHRRLSKLILAVALSTEVQELLKQRFVNRALTISTTAFTDKPESMKYRGVFHLVSRKENFLNYLGHAGKWTLEGAFNWWTRGHWAN